MKSIIVAVVLCLTDLLMIECLGDQTCTYEGDVRLRGGTEFAGRVEVCHNVTWVTICDRLWYYQTAEVVCNLILKKNASGRSIILVRIYFDRNK